MGYQVKGENIARRGFYGWEASQRIMLTDRVYIEVRTMKRYSGYLVTTASVWTIEGDTASSTMVGQDWYRTLIANKVRVTRQAVERQQAAGLEMALGEAQGAYNQSVRAGTIEIPAEQSLLNQVKDGNGDAWVAAAKAGQVMRIM